MLGGAGVDRIDGGSGFDVCRSAEIRVSCEETRPALPSRIKIPPGAYTTDLFRPRIAFSLGAGWLADEQTILHVDVIYSPVPGRRDPPILDFDSISAGRPVAAVVADIRAVQGLNATAPTPATIGGAAGQEFEVSIPATGSPIFVPGTAQLRIDPDDRARIFVLDVSGQTVILIAGSTFEDHDSSLPVLDQVLSTLKWEG